MNYDRLSNDEEPKSVYAEICYLLSIAWPVSLYISTQFIQVSTDFAILGHYETKYLAGATLADTWMQVAQVFIRGPFSLNALIGQAMGAENYKLCSIWLQMGIILDLIMILPCGILYWLTPDALRLLQQDEETIPNSKTYARWMILSLLPLTMMDCCRNYMSGLKIVKPAALVQCCSIFVNFGLAYYLVFHALGYIGTPIATSSTRLFTLIIYCTYIFGIAKLHQETWTPWNFRNYTWSRWKTLMSFFFPHILSQAAEGWSFQTIAFFAGHMGQNQIAVMNFTVVIFLIFHSVSIGIGIATNVRISNHLGANDVQSAKHTAKSSLVIVGFFGMSAGLFLYFGKSIIAHTMSNDPAVHEIFYEIVPFIVMALSFLCILTDVMLMLIGMGRPALVPAILGPCTWLVNIPAAWFFAFWCNFGIRGLWMGLTSGYFIASLLLIYFICTPDWQKYADLARERAEATSQTIQNSPQITSTIVYHEQLENSVEG